ncbi:MAG: serine hydrolase domain-containing protein [Chloroflexota bacterium]
MTTATNITGTTDPRFRAVEDAFRENFNRFPELGSALCVYVDGKPVVDIWGGFADAARTRPWERDTVVNVWSTTKGIVAACAHRLADQGKLDLDAPVAKYWPEFAQAGKEKLPVRYLLSHQAGLSALIDPMPIGSMFSWQAMTDALAKQEPWWEPGTKHGYHAFTYGWLVGEVIRRVSGKSVRDYVRDELAVPLGLDFQIGLAESDYARAADCLTDPSPPDPDNFLLASLSDPTSITFKAIMNPPDAMLPGNVNSREWRTAEIPAANGHTTARSVARLYAALSLGGELDGVRLMSRESVARAATEQCYGPDEVIKLPMRWALGFGLSSEGVDIGPNPHAFGHSGFGGSLGLADPDARIGFGYVMNQMLNTNTLGDDRWAPLLEAVYAAVG